MSKPTGALRALAREGLAVERDGSLVRIRSLTAPHGLTAEVLLPADHPLDAKALKQLVAFAGVRHPAGGEVRQAFATPDFHPGSVVPVGCVLATTRDIVIPQAIGTDINCGMRLHVADLTLDHLIAKKPEWLKALKGDLLMSTRDIPMDVPQIRAMFRSGPFGWLEEVERRPLGLLARADLRQLQDELNRSFDLGGLDGDDAYAPHDMLPEDRDVVRDCFMGTLGGGNHFVELQVVEEVLDRAWAFQWGVRKNQIAVMAHSGSRRVGIIVGQSWMKAAKDQWPLGVPHPDNGIFALHGEAAASYVKAMNAAANYAAVNRLLLVEMVRDRLRQCFPGLELPLVFDAPHNIVTEECGCYVHRKGATPARFGHPVLIPGSMGQASYLMVGLGNERFLQSASHGAGRKLSRRDMHRLDKAGTDIGLDAIECVTLKNERLVQEAPAAYKDIGPVVQVQVDAGIAVPVARLRPILTFKG
jgi:tRNA-splicing ligase RtcB (3'-phosphate/5'-hydroxy nucleic acid ligase)